MYHQVQSVKTNLNSFVLRAGQELSQVRGDVCQGVASSRAAIWFDYHQFRAMSFKTRDNMQDDSRFQKDFAQVVGKLFGFGPESFWTFSNQVKFWSIGCRVGKFDMQLRLGCQESKRFGFFWRSDKVDKLQYQVGDVHSNGFIARFNLTHFSMFFYILLKVRLVRKSQ